jgi:predicted aspartyl protease
MKRAALVASAVTAITAAAVTQAQAANPCQLVKLAEWSVQPTHYRPVVDALINGQRVGLLLDTGAAVSLIHPFAVKRLQLTMAPRPDTRMFGIGGESRVAGVTVDEFKIGDAKLSNWQAIVAGEQSFGRGIDMLLGYDFFHQTDVEFDLANNAIRLFEARNCEGVSLAYWTREAGEVALEPTGTLQVTIAINGTSLIAELDSGSDISTLSMIAARHLGKTAESPGVVSGACARGLGKIRVDSWIAPFESFAIGGELIRDPKIHFSELWKHARTEETGSHIARRVRDEADMLLGADFLRTHRVLVSHRQRKMYFSYVGGTVFPPTAGKPCSELKD